MAGMEEEEVTPSESAMTAAGVTLSVPVDYSKLHYQFMISRSFTGTAAFACRMYISIR